MSTAWICTSQVQEFACKTCMALSLSHLDNDDNDVCVRRVMSSVWHWPKKLQAELLRMPRRPTPLPPLSAEGKTPHPHLNGRYVNGVSAVALHVSTCSYSSVSNQHSAMVCYSHKAQKGIRTVKLCVANTVLYQAGDRYNTVRACLYLLSKVDILSGQAFMHQACITAMLHVLSSFPCCGGLITTIKLIIPIILIMMIIVKTLWWAEQLQCADVRRNGST